jgi:hypothetical protein
MGQKGLTPSLHEIRPVLNSLESPKVANSKFHKMWTDAVGKKGYNKKEWMRLQEVLLKEGVIRQVPSPSTS